jgi:hypothetical protein
MFIELNGDTYAVRIVRVGNSTFSELMKVKSNGEFQHTDLVGEVRLYHADRFDAQTGRKLSLARLLDKVQKHFSLKGDLNDVVRELIWQQFFKKYGV